jgi:adenylate cyclase
MSPATIREAMLLDEQALQKDSGLVDAKTAIAAMLIAYLANGRSSAIERDEERAEELLRDALEHDPNDAQARKILGILRRVQSRLTEAQIELETSIAVDPNDTFSLRNLGSTLVQMGRPEAAIPYIEKSIRLSPQDPFIAPNYPKSGS